MVSSLSARPVTDADEIKTPMRPGLPPAPPRIAKLPRDHRGYPVPWFVDWADGKPVFQAMDMHKRVRAVRQRLCWVCGEPLGRFMAFVIGPMCAISRTTSEPPSHRECAEWSATACPFLTRPHMARNHAAAPEGIIPAPGLPIDRNPGCACVWVTKSYKPFKVGARGPGTGWLITVGDPVAVGWYAHGRAATRAEAEAAIASGLPILLGEARKDGPAGVAAFESAVTRVRDLLPGGAMSN